MLNAKIVAEIVVLSFICGIGFGLMISLCWRNRRKEKKDERTVDGKAHRTQTKGGVKWKRKKLLRRYKQGHTRSGTSRIVVARLTGASLAGYWRRT